MRAYVFHRPNPGQPIDLGLGLEGTEANHTGTVRFSALHVRCRHGGEHHEIKIDDVVLTEAA